MKIEEMHQVIGYESEEGQVLLEVYIQVSLNEHSLLAGLVGQNVTITKEPVNHER